MPSSFDAAGGSSTTSCGSFDVMRQPSASAQNAASRAGSRQSMLTFWIRRVKSSPYGSTIVSHVEAPRRASLLPSRAFLQSPRSIVDRPVVARSHPSREIFQESLHVPPAFDGPPRRRFIEIEKLLSECT